MEKKCTDSLPMSGPVPDSQGNVGDDSLVPIREEFIIAIHFTAD
jgi:hypothetical protein